MVSIRKNAVKAIELDQHYLISLFHANFSDQSLGQHPVQSLQVLIAIAS